MPAALTENQAMERRDRLLSAARWCFLNFGFAKTTLQDVARRANLSRPLLYRSFKSKEELYGAVFVDWLVSQEPSARQAARAPESPTQRLFDVCRILVLDPWAEMVTTAMGTEFVSVCRQIDPEADALYKKVLRECVATVLGDDDGTTEVFLLALDGQISDSPPASVLERRTRKLVERFTHHPNDDRKRR